MSRDGEFLNHKGHKDHKEIDELTRVELQDRRLRAVADATRLLRRSRHPEFNLPSSFFAIFVSFVVKMI
jgi:hypothetical protein